MDDGDDCRYAGRRRPTLMPTSATTPTTTTTTATPSRSCAAAAATAAAATPATATFYFHDRCETYVCLTMRH